MSLATLPLVTTEPTPAPLDAEHYATYSFAFETAFAALSEEDREAFFTEFGTAPEANPAWRNPTGTALEVILRAVVNTDIAFDVPGHPVELVDEISAELFARAIDAEVATRGELSLSQRESAVLDLTFG